MKIPRNLKKILFSWQYSGKRGVTYPEILRIASFRGTVVAKEACEYPGKQEACEFRGKIQETNYNDN